MWGGVKGILEELASAIHPFLTLVQCLGGLKSATGDLKLSKSMSCLQFTLFFLTFVPPRSYHLLAGVKVIHCAGVKVNRVMIDALLNIFVLALDENGWL